MDTNLLLAEAKFCPGPNLSMQGITGLWRLLVEEGGGVVGGAGEGGGGDGGEAEGEGEFFPIGEFCGGKVAGDGVVGGGGGEVLAESQ